MYNGIMISVALFCMAFCFFQETISDLVWPIYSKQIGKKSIGGSSCNSGYNQNDERYNTLTSLLQGFELVGMVQSTASSCITWAFASFSKNLYWIRIQVRYASYAWILMEFYDCHF